MGNRLLSLLAYGLPLLTLLTAAMLAGYGLAQAASDAFSAQAFFAAMVVGVGLITATLLALVAVLGIRAVREVE